MIKSNTSISQVKKIIAEMNLKTVEVTVNLGRNKYARFQGVLSGVYPALFTVKPFDKDYRGKTSYSYSEYLCGKVRLKETASGAK
ncbi:MAG: Veg family protein [Clostridia bacterium]|nr:Veg family protein [Clostridia bacterium]